MLGHARVARGLLASAAIAVLAVTAGCQQPNQYAPPPPPKVSVARPQVKDVTDYLEFTGTTRAQNTVEIRARVGGYLKQIHFEDGAFVQQGDLLFTLEQEPFEVALASAEAALQKAIAGRQLAEISKNRSELLVQRQAISQEDVDVSRANLATANADVAAAQASVARAKLDLSYAKINSPISGRIGRHQIDPGTLVVPQTTVLAVIETTQPIDVTSRSMKATCCGSSTDATG
jgi:RND family efflux transporter MFP subunit